VFITPNPNIPVAQGTTWQRAVRETGTFSSHYLGLSWKQTFTVATAWSRLLVKDVWYTRCFAGWQYSRDDAFPYFSCQSKPPTLPLKSNHASIPEQGKSFLLISKMSRSALEPTQPPTDWVPGALSSAAKRPGREVSDPSLCRFTVTNDSQYAISSWHVSSRAKWQLRRVPNGKYSLEEGNDATPATSYISQTTGNVRHGISTID
jgi:hypothetical protein